MPKRRIVYTLAFLFALSTIFLAKYRQLYHYTAQAQAPTFYAAVNLKGEALKKAVDDNPGILTQLNPEGRNLLSLIFSYQRPSAEDVQMLLEKGADARNTDNDGNGVLNFAVGSGTPKIITLLVNAGADVNQRDHIGFTPLRNVARIPGDTNKDKAELLISLGAHLDAFSAAALGKTAELQRLISTDPDSLNEDVFSPIDWAAMHHQKAVLNAIADSHPRVNMFRAAALGDQSAVTDALRKAPGTVNTTDQHGRTSLDWAVMAEDESMAKFLLEHGANPNLSRALFMVARNGNVEIARLLLDHGADPSDPQANLSAEQREALEEGNPYKAADPYKVAMNAHHPEVAELIKEARKQSE